MSWDFQTDPEFQEQLDWMDEFVRTEIEPLDLLEKMEKRDRDRFELDENSKEGDMI